MQNLLIAHLLVTACLLGLLTAVVAVQAGTRTARRTARAFAQHDHARRGVRVHVNSA